MCLVFGFMFGLVLGLVFGFCAVFCVAFFKKVEGVFYFWRCFSVGRIGCSKKVAEVCKVNKMHS